MPDIREEILSSFGLNILLPLEDNHPLSKELTVHYTQVEKNEHPDEKKLKEKDPDVVSEADYKLPLDKINYYTEDSFYDQVLVKNGLAPLKIKDKYIDLSSPQAAYPSLMVGAYIKRVYEVINRNPGNPVDIEKARQNLEKARYYVLKVNNDSIKQIYKNNLVRVFYNNI